MELLFWLLGFYVFQCIVSIPDGAVLLRRSGRSWRWIEGPGWDLGPLLPSAPMALCQRRKWRPANADQREHHSSQVAADGYSFSAAREAGERFATAAWWLLVLSNVSFAVTFGGLPLLFAMMPPNEALLVFAPAYGVLHVLGLTAVYLAHRRLFPDDRDGRFEVTLSAALYPPALLRAAQTLRVATFAPFDPAVVAALLLPRHRAFDFIRMETTRLDHRSPGADGERGNASGDVETAFLAVLANGMDTTIASILAPPCPRDPSARSFCRICHSQYVLKAGTCGECEADLCLFPPVKEKSRVPVVGSGESGL